MTVQDVQATINNLTNVVDNNKTAFASFEMAGKILGNAPLRLTGNLNPYASSPTFEFDATLENVQLAQLNPWLRAYADVNAAQGSFSMYSSCAAVDNKFRGYVKPIMHDVHIVGVQEESSNPLQKVWAALVQGVATLLKNQSKDQLATKIPFSGAIDHPEAGVLTAIANILRNAFVAAFSHSLDQSLHLQDVNDSDFAPQKP